MQWKRSVPAILLALMIIWIVISLLYRDYNAQAKSYLQSVGRTDLLPSSTSDVAKGEQLALQNRKDIDAILKKLKMNPQP